METSADIAARFELCLARFLMFPDERLELAHVADHLGDKDAMKHPETVGLDEVRAKFNALSRAQQLDFLEDIESCPW